MRRLLTLLLCSTIAGGAETATPADAQGRLVATIEWLQEGDPHQRRDALTAFLSTASTSDIDDLLACIGRRRMHKATPVVVMLANHEDTWVARAALETLAKTPLSAEHLDDVRHLLTHGDSSVRKRAIHVCLAARDDQALPQLIEMVNDPQIGVAREAHAALTVLTGRHIPAEALRWRQWYQEEIQRFEASAPAWKAALAGTDVDAAVVAIGQIAACAASRGEAASLLTEALSSQEPRVAGAARVTLEALGVPVAEPSSLESPAVAQVAAVPAPAPAPAPVPTFAWLPFLVFVAAVGACAVWWMRLRPPIPAATDAADSASHLRRAARVTVVITTRIWRRKLEKR